MKLKPCPFCGGEAFMESWIARKGFEANVHCNSCSAMVYTITYDFEEQAEKNAIEQWNRRESMDRIVEQLEEKADEANDKWMAYGQEDDYFDGKEDGIREAIEIVKDGTE